MATPSKCPGREAPSQPSLTPRTDTVVATGAGQSGYISRHRGHEDHVDPRLGAHGQILLQGAGVVGDVLGVAELQRVHEDADGHRVALGPGPGHQRDVPGVQRPHGGHQPDRMSAGPGLCKAWRQPAAVSTTCTAIAYTAAGTVGRADSASCVARAAPAW